MMKTLLFFLFLSFLPFYLYTQSICEIPDQIGYLHANNIRAAVSNRGYLFRTGKKGVFQVPYSGPNSPGTFYENDIWFSALDSAGNILLKAVDYKQDLDCGYIPGPWIEGSEEDQYKLATNWNKLFKVTQGEILAHIEDYQDGHIDKRIESIFGWPGKGNKFFKEINGFELFENTKAGFHETSGHINGIYEPQFGEYPEVNGLNENSIPGEIIWTVFCAGKTKRELEKGEKIKLEVQQIVWAMSCDDDLTSNSIFTRYYVSNKSDEPYYNFTFGLFSDLDLGCLYDDYVGCFPELSSFYAYNSDNDDNPDCNKTPGYGQNPPVQVVSFLGNNTLDGFYVIGIQGDFPDEIIEYYRLMNGLWTDGTAITHFIYENNTWIKDTVDYMYPDDPTDAHGWSMYSDAMFMNDRKVLGVSRQADDYIFESGATLQYDIAYSFYRKAGLNNLENIIYAKIQIPELQNLYSGGLSACPPVVCDCECVWPCDADNNGIVEFKDIVNMFKNMGNTGPVRNGDLSWNGKVVENWEQNNYTLVNPKYSDSNGDGIIDMNDVEMVKDYVGNTNSCYLETETFCEQGNALKWEYVMRDSVLKRNKLIKTKIRINDNSGFMGLYYKIDYNPDIFRVLVLNNQMVWEDDSINNLFYETSNMQTNQISVIQFNDKKRNSKLQANNNLISLNFIIKNIPESYPTKYVDIKICEGKMYYDNGSEKNLPGQTLRFKLPDNVKITGTKLINKEKVLIYPNPSSGILFLDSAVKGKATLEMFNLNGSLLLRKNINLSQNKLDIHELNSGIYILKLTGENINLIKKLIIM